MPSPSVKTRRQAENKKCTKDLYIEPTSQADTPLYSFYLLTRRLTTTCMYMRKRESVSNGKNYLVFNVRIHSDLKIKWILDGFNFKWCNVSIKFSFIHTMYTMHIWNFGTCTFSFICSVIFQLLKRRDIYFGSV